MSAVYTIAVYMKMMYVHAGPGSSPLQTMTLSFFFLGLGFLLFIFPITILERSSVEWFERLKLAATDFSSLRHFKKK